MNLRSSLAVFFLACSIALAKDDASSSIAKQRVVHVLSDERWKMLSEDDLQFNDMNKKYFRSVASALDALSGNKESESVVQIEEGIYYESISIDSNIHSNIRIRGRGIDKTIVSGGLEVPPRLFTKNSVLSQSSSNTVYSANLSALNISSDELTKPGSNGCVHGCSSTPTPLSFGGQRMHLARWPNLDQDSARNVYVHLSTGCGAGCFEMDADNKTYARMLQWANETDAFVHGYWEWDWADCYREIRSIERSESSAVRVSMLQSDVTPKSNARFYGVNILSELDAPGEYYMDLNTMMLHVVPPAGVDGTPDTWTAGPVLGGLSSGDAEGAVLRIDGTANVTVEHISIVDGVIGIHAENVSDATIDSVSVKLQAQEGIVMTKATSSTVRNASISLCGCGGIRAHGGDARTFTRGNNRVVNTDVTLFGLWKRTYEAGIHWSGVGNTFSDNVVYDGPHNCFLGGGNEADEDSLAGVDNVFERNTLERCAYEAADTGAFYVCGQMASAFVNRNNTIRNNTFRSVRNTVGTGVQEASVQAIYLDDQMSGWTIEQNRFLDCQVGSFIGGGRRNRVIGNYYEHCDTAQHIDNRGMNWENAATNCSTDPCEPLDCQCNLGGVSWMLQNPMWAKRFPFLSTISHDRLCQPAYNVIANNTFCKCGRFIDAAKSQTDAWGTTVESNEDVMDCT